MTGKLAKLDAKLAVELRKNANLRARFADKPSIELFDAINASEESMCRIQREMGEFSNEADRDTDN